MSVLDNLNASFDVVQASNISRVRAYCITFLRCLRDNLNYYVKFRFVRR